MTAYVITTICTGNICRSPMAEAVIRADVARAGLAARVVVDSGGTGGWHAGSPADPRAHETLVASGYSLDHRARQLEPGWRERTDLFLAMDRGHYEHILELAPDAQVRMMRSFDPELAHVALGDPALDVPDPYHGAMDGFVECLAMIERASAGLMTELPTMLAAR